MGKHRKVITIRVGERRFSGKHEIMSEYSRTETINVMKNLAELLEREYPAVKFKES